MAQLLKGYLESYLLRVIMEHEEALSPKDPNKDYMEGKIAAYKDIQRVLEETTLT